MHASASLSEEQKFPERNTTAPDARAAYIILPAVPDEALISVVGRFHILSSNRDTSSTFHELFNRTPFNLLAWMPPHVEVLAQQLGTDIVRHTSDVLSSHTLYRLLCIFNGISARPMTFNNRVTSTLRRSAPEPLRLCLRCLHEDTAAFGVRYIHLSHQIPWVEVCSRHGTSLFCKCPFCNCMLSPRNGLILAPWRSCTCKNYVFDASETQTQTQDEFALSYAKFTNELLTSQISNVPSSRLVECYKTRAREIGFEWRSDKVNRTQLMVEMENYYGKAFLSRVDAAYRHQRLSCWFRMLGSSTAYEPPLGRHLLFAHFLFRNAAYFRAALEALGNINHIENKTKQLRTKSRSEVSPKDNELAQEIMNISAALYSSAQKPEKITKNRIIRNINWNPYNQHKYVFPKSMVVLENAFESNWYFYARRIIWAKLTHKYASNSVIRREAGVRGERGVILTNVFQDIDLSIPLCSGTLTKLLTDRGIYRDWAGPCPEREFAPTGRSFYENK